MAGGRSPEEGDRRAVADEARLARRLNELGARLDARKPPVRPRDDGSGPPEESRAQNLARAFRLSSEFIGGIVVGGIIGWVIDWAAGTSPWGLIVFVLLGFAAGTLNVLRSAGLVASQSMDRDGS